MEKNYTNKKDLNNPKFNNNQEDIEIDIIKNNNKKSPMINRKKQVNNSKKSDDELNSIIDNTSNFNSNNNLRNSNVDKLCNSNFDLNKIFNQLNDIDNHIVSNLNDNYEILTNEDIKITRKIMRYFFYLLTINNI